jgi:hypothetical protein
VERVVPNALLTSDPALPFALEWRFSAEDGGLYSVRRATKQNFPTAVTESGEAPGSGEPLVQELASRWVWA